ncbi:MAG: hypothetical protein M3237_17125 [Actinomycetota bacterium]|nr:hypothetical protein [Actinomycetota bacterium]
MTTSHHPAPSPTSAPTARGASLPRRWAILILSLLLGVAGLGALAESAAAAPVYEITGKWVNQLPTIARGNPAVAEWRINVNDDAPAPSNGPVDNVTATFTVEKGFFDEIPDKCLTEGVDPPSSISEDGMTLTCNFGTVNMGTAIVMQTPVVADGITGDEVVLDGTSPSGETVELPPIPIRNTFAMDIQYGGTSPHYIWDDLDNPTYVDVDLQWSLRLGKGSDPGPNEVTYRLDVGSNTGAAIDVGQHYTTNDVGCTPFNYGRADGHPWSPETTVPTQPEQNTNFVDECILTEVSPGVFDLTLRGINYDLANVPTHDSSAANGTGNPLPPAWDYIASGSLFFRVHTSQPGSISLDSNEPTYRSTTGLTSVDLPSNNTSNKSYTLPGTWSASWWRGYTQSGGTPWDDTYRVSPGTTLLPHVNNLGNRLDAAPSALFGECLVFDTAYVSYVPKPAEIPYEQIRGLMYNDPSSGDPLDNPPPMEYYVGDVGNPDQFNCGTGTWTTTEPADLSTIQAIRIVYPHSLYDAEGIDGIQLNAHVRINDNAPVGQDVWMFGSVLQGTGQWWGPENAGVITPTPGARYSHTNGRRDIVRIVTALPYLEKDAAKSTVTPGVPAEFTLTYSANGSGIIPPSVDGYTIRDVLPLGMTYQAGSATPEPVLSTNAQGRQVLTWTLNGVTTNEEHELVYEAVADSNIPPGTQLTNTAVSSYGGEDSAPVDETVTTTTNGYTDIGKVADTPFIPNLDGSGDGEGVWTVTLRSFDPLPQSFTDTIDILPYEGDNRGTDYEGTYSLVAVEPVVGANVFYTTADPATLSDDPADPMNGAPNNPVGNTVGWSPVFTPDATAVRVIGPRLAPGATQAFKVRIATDGADPRDMFVNRAQARTGHTELKMRTSAPMSVAHYYSANLKKYVQDAKGAWRDANDVTDYPAFKLGDTVRYRIVITNTGQGTLTNLDITDDQFEQGSFHVDSLAPGEQESHEFSSVIPNDAVGTLVNTACAEADIPEDSQVTPTINCDPAGRELVNYVTKKVADPKSGSPVQAGEVIHYTVSVTQKGTVPAEAVFTDKLAKVLDDARYNRDATASIGRVRYVDGSLVWAGTVPVGQVALVKYSVTVNKDLRKLGDRKLVNPVTSPGCVVKKGETVNCRTNHRVPKFDLMLDKRVIGATRVAVGGKVQYGLRVTNNGPDVAPGPIRLVDRLPNGLELVSARGKGWDCKVDKSSDKVVCKRNRDLAPDRKAPRVTVVAKATKAALGGRLVNTAQVSAGGDMVRSNNRDAADVSVGRVPPPSTGFRLLLRDWF